MFSGSSTYMNTDFGRKEVKVLNFPAVDESETTGSEPMETQHVSIPETIHLSNLHVQIPNLVTLSLLPKSQWQSLTKLDIIKVLVFHFFLLMVSWINKQKKSLDLQARNKPIEPPKKPEKAPFFLPSVPSLSGDIVFENNDKGTMDKQKVNQVDLSGRTKIDVDLPSQFLQQLQSCADSGKRKFLSSTHDFLLCLPYKYYLNFYIIVIQMGHSQTIYGVYLHQLWTWSFECFKS